MPKTVSPQSRLEKLVRKSRETHAQVPIRVMRRKTPIAVAISTCESSTGVCARGTSTKQLKLPITLWGEPHEITPLLAEFVEQLPRPVEFDLGMATGTRNGVDCEEFTHAVVAVLCELAGQKVPTERQLQAAQKKQAVEAKRLCRKFAADIRERKPAGDPTKWNKTRAKDRDRWLRRLGELREAVTSRQKVSLAGANLKGANLSWLSFSLFDMSRAKLQSATMRGDFGHTNFTSANLRKANLSKASCAHTRFIETDLTDALFNDAEMLGAQFIGAILKRADLRGTGFDRATFENVMWDGAMFDERTRWPVGFTPPEELKWCGAGGDPRAAQRESTATRKPPRKLTVAHLLSDKMLREFTKGMSSDPQLPDGVGIDEKDRSPYAEDLRFSILLEFLPHRLADLRLSQKEIDLNTWYRCERYVQVMDAVEGGYAYGDHERADQWAEMVWSDLGAAEYMKVLKRIQREARKLAK